MNLGWAPREGWRTFAGEVGVIVLGVLIALGAQQAVDAWNEHQNRVFTERALRDEIGINAGFAFERLIIEPCLKKRLHELDEKLAGGGPWRGMPAALGKVPVAGTRAITPVYRTPQRNWLSSAWTTANASAVLIHMDRARVAQFADIYRQIDILRDTQHAELAAAPNLSFLARDQSLDPAARTDGQNTLAQLDAQDDLVVTVAQQLLDDVRAMRLNYPPAAVAKGAAQAIAIQRQFRGKCVRNLRLNL